MLTEKSQAKKGVADRGSGYRFSWFDRFCLWYPPGWLILFNRHWQHYQPDPDGWIWLEYILFLIPGGFYVAFLIRWLRLGCRSPRSYACDFNPEYQQLFRDEVLTPIIEYYFSAELRNVDNLPETGPLIVAMNHTGMSFPWDILALGYLLGKIRGWNVQPLAHPMFFDHPWLTWWLPPGWSKVLGGIQAQADTFEAAIAQKKIILYAPEGLRGPSKAWTKRYQLQKFHPSFIQLSEQYSVPILPAICIGSEFLHPWTINLKRWAKRAGLPLLPLSPLMIPFVLFPSMGVWAAKTRLQYYIQPLYQPGTATEMTTASPIPASTAYQKAQRLRETLQAKMNSLLAGKL